MTSQIIRLMLERKDYPDVLPKILDLLRLLCGQNGIYPNSFALQKVTKDSGSPISKGGFGSVWQAMHQGRSVAVKIVTNAASGSDVMKVSPV